MFINKIKSGYSSRPGKQAVQKGNKMRTNDRKYTSKKRVAVGTPLHDRMKLAINYNSTVAISGIDYKVVDDSEINHSTVTEFYLLKNRIKTQGA